MDIETKQLTLDMIDGCQEIQSWLDQFKASALSNAAKSMLLQLKFISRDDYSQWLINKLSEYVTCSCAVYAIRKFDKQVICLWNDEGTVQQRPAQTQGSEDLVASVIANANRLYNNCFIDHPSLTVLKKKKIHNIILIDDSIGSGKRVSDFINLMTNHKTFLSWWSYGFITIHILSYARTRQSEKYIINKLSGSDHGKRKFRKSDKLKFNSSIVYDADNIANRWGKDYQAIHSLCNIIVKIRKDRRKGFGDVMGNIIFYHSVPNNIPGMLYLPSPSWNPLFPGRVLPDWMINLLEKKQKTETIKIDYKLPISGEVDILLQNIKKGVRTKHSLSRRMDSDISIIEGLIKQALRAGFITEQLRLTKAGIDYIQKNKVKPFIIRPNYSLYIPKSWRAGQRTIQPSVPDTSNGQGQTDSIDF